MYYFYVCFFLKYTFGSFFFFLSLPIPRFGVSSKMYFPRYSKSISSCSILVGSDWELTYRYDQWASIMLSCNCTIFSRPFGSFECSFGNVLKFRKLFLIRDTFSNKPLDLSLFSSYYAVKGFGLIIL
jgi:hypothetical protein